MQYLLEEGKPPKIEGIHLFISHKLFWSIERERIRAEEVSYEKVRSFALKEAVREDLERDKSVRITRYGNYDILRFSQSDLDVYLIVYGWVRDIQEILIKHQSNKNLENLKSDLGALMRSGMYDGIDWAQGLHDARKMNLFENVLLGLKRHAEKQQIVLFIDDLHLADTATIDLFLYLARNFKKSRILLLGTLNTEVGLIPENWKDVLEQIELEQSVEIITIENLAPEDVREIFCVGTGIRLTRELEKLIYEITGGNPLFVTEYLQHLKNNYAFRTEKELIKILKSGKLPETLSTLVLTRFEKLSKIEREVCISLAVLRFAEAEILSNLCGHPIEKRYQVISALDDKGILPVHGKFWKFVNSTFADAIYSMLSNIGGFFSTRKP